MLKKQGVASRIVGMATSGGVVMAGAFASAAAARAQDGGHFVTDALDYVRLYPLAGGPLDVLSNNLKVPVGGTEVSTFPITAPLRDGLPVGELPVVKGLLP